MTDNDSFDQVLPKVINSLPRRVMLSGGSLYVGIPKGLAAELGIEKGDVVAVRRDGADSFKCRLIWKGLRDGSVRGSGG